MSANDATDKDEDRPGGWQRIKRLFNSAPKTTEDVVAIVDAASENEVIDNDARRIIEGALEVSEMQARDIMIPRTQMTLLKASDPLQDNLKKIIQSGHSRYPVIGENTDDVVGILLSKDLLGPVFERNRQLNQEIERQDSSSTANPTALPANEINLLSLLRPPVFVPESKRLNVLLKQFREDRNHMALVIDEYGSLAGLITIEDVLEEIVGEIEDEHDDTNNTQIRRISDSHFVINALTPIDEFNEYFKATLEDDEFDTMGGLVTHRFGHLPKRNEQISVGEYTFHVMQADSRRLRMLRMTVDHSQHQSDELAS